VRDTGEECDSLTFCSDCECYPGYEPASTTSVTCVATVSPLCGNGRRDGGEECDGGNQCTNCACNLGFAEVSPVSLDCGVAPVIPATCGNLIRDTGEECDGGLNCINCLCSAGYGTISSTSVACTKKYEDLIWFLNIPFDCSASDKDDNIELWTQRIYSWVAEQVQLQNLDVDFTNKLTCDEIITGKRVANDNQTSTVTFSGPDVDLAVYPGQIPVIDLSQFVDSGDGGGLSGGAIAGIVIGCIVALIIIVVIVFLLVAKKDNYERA